MGGVGLIEFVEDVGQVLLRHPRPLVAHADQHPSFLFPGADRDDAARGAEFDRVVQQVGPHLGQQALVAVVEDDGQLHRQPAVFGRPFGLQLHDGAADLLVQPEGPPLQGAAAVLDLGQGEDVAHQIGQTARVFEDALHAVVPLLLAQAGVLQQHGIAFDGGDGGLEFVGHVGHEIVAQGLDAGQVLHHGVEVLAGLPDLVDLGVRIHPHAEIAPGHLLRGLGQAQHGLEDAAADIGGKQGAHQDADHTDDDDGQVVQVHHHAGADQQQAEAAHQHHGDEEDVEDDDRIVEPQGHLAVAQVGQAQFFVRSLTHGCAPVCSLRRGW